MKGTSSSSSLYQAQQLNALGSADANAQHALAKLTCN